MGGAIANLQQRASGGPKVALGADACRGPTHGSAYALGRSLWTQFTPRNGCPAVALGLARRLETVITRCEVGVVHPQGPMPQPMPQPMQPMHQPMPGVPPQPVPVAPLQAQFGLPFAVHHPAPTALPPPPPTFAAPSVVPCTFASLRFAKSLQVMSPKSSPAMTE